MYETGREKFLASVVAACSNDFLRIPFQSRVQIWMIAVRLQV